MEFCSLSFPVGGEKIKIHKKNSLWRIRTRTDDCMIEIVIFEQLGFRY